MVVSGSGHDRSSSDRTYVGLNSAELATQIRNHIFPTLGDGPHSSGAKRLLKRRANHKKMSRKSTRMESFDSFMRSHGLENPATGKDLAFWIGYIAECRRKGKGTSIPANLTREVLERNQDISSVPGTSSPTYVTRMVRTKRLLYGLCGLERGNIPPRRRSQNCHTQLTLLPECSRSSCHLKSERHYGILQ